MAFRLPIPRASANLQASPRPQTNTTFKHNLTFPPHRDTSLPAAQILLCHAAMLASHAHSSRAQSSRTPIINSSALQDYQVLAVNLTIPDVRPASLQKWSPERSKDKSYKHYRQYLIEPITGHLSKHSSPPIPAPEHVQHKSFINSRHHPPHKMARPPLFPASNIKLLVPCSLR